LNESKNINFCFTSLQFCSTYYGSVLCFVTISTLYYIVPLSRTTFTYHFHVPLSRTTFTYHFHVPLSRTTFMGILLIYSECPHSSFIYSECPQSSFIYSECPHSSFIYSVFPHIVHPRQPSVPPGACCRDIIEWSTWDLSRRDLSGIHKSRRESRCSHEQIVILQEWKRVKII